jgi:hypothetical protein
LFLNLKFLSFQLFVGTSGSVDRGRWYEKHALHRSLISLGFIQIC